MAAEESSHQTEYRPSVRRAWAGALELANLQVEVLTQLHDADRRADDADVQRCVAALDHVMAQVAAAERVRRNLSDDVSGDVSDDTATIDEPTCVECGALAQPVYDPPRLLGYRCPRCEWTADDPVSQAAGRLDAARDAAVGTVRQASEVIQVALDNVRQRRKKQQYEHGLRELEAMVASLGTAARRVRRAEDQLRAAQRDASSRASA